MSENKNEVTKEEIKINFRHYGEITIPKGTRITHNTANGFDPDYNFIVDLTWINKKENYPLWHDAYYYGIDIDASLIETI